MTAKSAKTLRIEFALAVHPSDEWEFNDPAFSFGDRIKIIDESCPHKDWDEFVICAMELYAPRWKSPGTLMEMPQWRYGVRCPRGTGELVWFAEDEIVKTEHAYLISFEPEF
jgi:hypothetical protein